MPNIHSGTKLEVWTVGDNYTAEERHGDYACATINVFDGREAFRGTHFSAIEFWGQPETAILRRDRVLGFINALERIALHCPSLDAVGIREICDEALKGMKHS